MVYDVVVVRVADFEGGVEDDGLHVVVGDDCFVCEVVVVVECVERYF